MNEAIYVKLEYSCIYHLGHVMPGYDVRHFVGILEKKIKKTWKSIFAALHNNVQG